MEEENNKKIEFKKEEIETKPEDEFVHEADINSVNPDNYGKYFKGQYNSTVHMTDDPRITRPFVYSMCALFFAIGIISLIICLIKFNIISLLLGISFTVISIFAFKKSKSDIDEIAKKYEKEGKNVTINSKDETKEVIREFNGELKTSFNESISKTFTKDNAKKHLKKLFPIYIIISFLIFALISIFISVILGCIILIILAFCLYIYYLIVSKICKY